jgi:hypothetical protein
MAPASDLLSADMLPCLLLHLTRQDAAALSLTCTRAASAFASSNASLYTHAPRVIICCSDSKQLLELRLTPEGRPYLHQEKQLEAESRCSGMGSRRTRSQTALHSWPLRIEKVYSAKQW